MWSRKDLEKDYLELRSRKDGGDGKRSDGKKQVKSRYKGCRMPRERGWTWFYLFTIFYNFFSY